MQFGRHALHAAVLDVDPVPVGDVVGRAFLHAHDLGLVAGTVGADAFDVDRELARGHRRGQRVADEALPVVEPQALAGDERRLADAFAERLAVDQRVVELAVAAEADQPRLELAGASTTARSTRPGRRARASRRPWSAAGRSRPRSSSCRPIPRRRPDLLVVEAKPAMTDEVTAAKPLRVGDLELVGLRAGLVGRRVAHGQRRPQRVELRVERRRLERRRRQVGRRRWRRAARVLVAAAAGDGPERQGRSTRRARQRSTSSRSILQEKSGAVGRLTRGGPGPGTAKAGGTAGGPARLQHDDVALPQGHGARVARGAQDVDDGLEDAAVGAAERDPPATRRRCAARAPPPWSAARTKSGRGRRAAAPA